MEDPDILIHPKKGRKEKDVPHVGLLLVNTTEAHRGTSRLLEEGGTTQSFFHSKLVVDASRTSFAAGPAIGAPMAVMTMERLIALGAKKIILCGWCGAISPERVIGDVLVPGSAVSGEGTSRYYLCPENDTVDSELAGELRSYCVQQGVTPQEARIWSTDGVFRESRRMLNQLHKEQGVDAVDMEFSALCAVARFRKIQFAGVMVVSDLLYTKSWEPGFSSRTFKERSQQVLDLLIDFCQMS